MRNFVRAMVCSFVVSYGILYAADPEITVAENPVKKNSFAKLTVSVEKGDMVSFQVFPTPTKRDSVGNVLYLNGPPGSKYTVLVTIVNFGPDPGDDSTKSYKKRFDSGSKDITIEGDGDDIDPNPGPNPAPVEATTLTNKLKAAIKKEPDGEKALIPKLQDLYSKYANETELAKYATWGDLMSSMMKDAKEYQVLGKLLNTQTTIQEFLVTKLPPGQAGWETLTITDKDRKNTKVVFQTVITALGKVK